MAGYRARRKQISFVILLVLAVLWTIPLLLIFFSSFKTEFEAINPVGWQLLPRAWNTQNYQELLAATSQAPMTRWFLNSLVAAGGHTAIYLVVASFAAYAYSRLRWRFRLPIFAFLLGTMMIPTTINLIVSYRLIVLFGWTNTPFALIVPGLGGTFGVFLLKKFMDNLPRELDEAATIDGANAYQRFWFVTVQMIRPALAVLALFAFVGIWNDFLWASLVNNKTDTYTLTVGMRTLQSVYGPTSVTKVMAGTVISAVPVIVIYAIGSRYLTRGITLTSGIKG